MFFLPVVWWLIAIIPIGSGMLEMTVRLVSTMPRNSSRLN